MMKPPSFRMRSCSRKALHVRVLLLASPLKNRMGLSRHAVDTSSPPGGCLHCWRFPMRSYICLGFRV